MQERIKQVICILVAMLLWMSLFFMGCGTQWEIGARGTNEIYQKDKTSSLPPLPGWGLRPE